MITFPNGPIIIAPPPPPQLATSPDQIINKRQTLTSGWSSRVAPALFSDPETWPHASHVNKCTHRHSYMGNPSQRTATEASRTLPPRQYTINGRSELPKRNEPFVFIENNPLGN